MVKILQQKHAQPSENKIANIQGTVMAPNEEVGQYRPGKE
jgi:hypothetical protein